MDLDFSQGFPLHMVSLDLPAVQRSGQNRGLLCFVRERTERQRWEVFLSNVPVPVTGKTRVCPHPEQLFQL
jgi:hypothetical protein